ncbi:FecR family protein [Sphingobacterium sp. HJSM2_6]|uniref:FecR family protein n=1 Tax=Sphingobacterium sp. HJSM2_6 TaxID=3366264 RepID=UPI003BD3BAA7
MNKEQLAKLLDQYTKGKLREPKISMLESWYLKEAREEKPKLTEAEVNDISNRIRTYLPLQYGKKSVRMTYWPRLVAAAVALLFVGTILYYYKSSRLSNSKQAESDLSVNVAPGKMNATLTLADGRKIYLTEAHKGEIANEAGISVVQTADGELVYRISDPSLGANSMNTLSTQKGETYRLILPDQSKVWLNAASSLTYTTGLKQNGKRRVKLQGEAYFQVSKDKSHPFIVETLNQEVEVLGTAFNINSYEDEPNVTTTLLEGSVKVKTANQLQILRPGEQSSTDGNKINVRKADLDQVVDWKNGEFNLHRIPFKAAMSKLARWYDVEVIYQTTNAEKLISGGWISRDASLKTILEGIEQTKQVKFKLEGRKLYVLNY